MQRYITHLFCKELGKEGFQWQEETLPLPLPLHNKWQYLHFPLSQTFPHLFFLYPAMIEFRLLSSLPVLNQHKNAYLCDTLTQDKRFVFLLFY